MNRAVTLILIALAVLATVKCNTLPSDVFEGWEGRIVGGSNANPGQFPYQASLRTPANFHFCGGTIISGRWVISAAHCTIDRTPANTFVVVGAHHRVNGGISHATSSIVNHEGYSAILLSNDISLVQTAGNIQFNANVQPIPIASVNTGGGVQSTASGWGQTSHPGSAAEILQHLNVLTLTVADCQSRHTFINSLRVTASTICTFTQVGQGMCMGDSGGPLVANGQVIGAVSWGIACAQGFPDVYARVWSHVNWINTNTQ